MLILILLFCKIVLGAIQFSITSTDCSGNGVFKSCNDVSAGGLCAFAADVNKTWCCVAGQGTCYDWGEFCTGAGNVAGNGQILCQNLGTTWCCNAKYEVCTPDAEQMNVCIANFGNPYSTMATAVALSIETAYLASGSSQSSLTVTTASTAPIQRTTSLMSTLSSSSNISTASSSSSSALSHGAIAGIVIGAIAGAALIAIASFLITRRGMRKSRDSKQPNAVGQVGLHGHQDYRYGLEVKSELPGLGRQRHPMQGTQSQTQMTEMQGMDAQELPE